MEQSEFFTSLKLIAIKQSGKSLDNCIVECKLGILIRKQSPIEQPLPEFKKEELKAFKSQIKEASILSIDKPVEVSLHDNFQDIAISVPESEYVKSGYFGMNSYTIYRIETKVIRGLNT